MSSYIMHRNIVFDENNQTDALFGTCFEVMLSLRKFCVCVCLIGMCSHYDNETYYT